MGFTLVPEQVKRMNRDGVAFVSLEEEGITSPVICSQRAEASDEMMAAAMTIVNELVQNRIDGKYP